ncbi:hypothetical protein THOE12_20734 [Vibrio rotiferianus]|nr:hypothetical protein THOE12_20734 [Vibrio rotiferianus]
MRFQALTKMGGNVRDTGPKRGRILYKTGEFSGCLQLVSMI